MKNSIKTLLGLVALSGATLISPITQADDTSYCREYTGNVNVGNKLQQAYGTACLQRDGSWKIVAQSNTPPPAIITQAVPVKTIVQERVALRPQPILYPAGRYAYYNQKLRHHDRRNQHKIVNNNHRRSPNTSQIGVRTGNPHVQVSYRY